MSQESAADVPIADGFDYPVGPRGTYIDVFKTHKVDTILVDDDYFKSLGYWHTGEDWNGRGGRDTDLGDPIYAIANGKVINSGQYPVWGNIVLIEHALPDNSRVWSQYAHLDKIMVTQVGQKVKRGQQIGTMGKGDKNRYLAHLHFEIRKKNLPINNWSPMVKDKNAVLANYYNPQEFIKSHRQLSITTTTSQTKQKATPPNTANIPPNYQTVLDTQSVNPKAGVGTFQKANVNNWTTAPNGYRGDMLWAQASIKEETLWAEWRPTLTESGEWQVWVFIPAKNANTSYARYTVVHLDGETEVPINQGGHRNQWINLGTYRFGPGQGYLRLSNLTGEMVPGAPLKIGFDAVCWAKADTLAQLAPPTEQPIRVLFEDGSVQSMPLEEYVRVIVPGEVPASWPVEALKAQAIAARSYAQYAIEHPRHAPHADICTTTHCQHYDPAKVDPRSDQAVKQTQGLIASYQGQTANTLYSSRCGGHTFSNNDVWKKAAPVAYLQAVSCPDKGKKFGHGIGMCQYGAKAFAEQGRTYDQIITHYYQGVTLISQSPISGV